MYTIIQVQQYIHNVYNICMSLYVLWYANGAVFSVTGDWKEMRWVQTNLGRKSRHRSFEVVLSVACSCSCSSLEPRKDKQKEQKARIWWDMSCLCLIQKSSHQVTVCLWQRRKNFCWRAQATTSIQLDAMSGRDWLLSSKHQSRLFIKYVIVSILSCYWFW